ncbi:MAG: twin-arginine translocase subunit TatB, partial [Mesorhizobium sp.]
TKTAAKKAEPKPAPAGVKKPAAAAKKTAGAAK